VARWLNRHRVGLAISRPPVQSRPFITMSHSDSKHVIHTKMSLLSRQYKQGVALTGRNATGPPCSVSRPTAHVPGRQCATCPRAHRLAGLTTGSVPTPHSHAPGSRPAHPPAVLHYRRRQTTTTASKTILAY